MNAISLAVDQFVAVLTIHNPPANALSSRILEELSSCLDQCETDAGVRSIIIHGEGRFFSAGADIKEFTSLKGNEDSSLLAGAASS